MCARGVGWSEALRLVCRLIDWLFWVMGLFLVIETVVANPPQHGTDLVFAVVLNYGG